MPLSKTTKIVIGVGIGTAVLVGGVIWYKRRKRAKVAAEAAAAAVVQAAAADGIAVPAGANALIKKGIELLNLGKITKYQMEVLFQALNKLAVGQPNIQKLKRYFQTKQPTEYAAWAQERAMMHAAQQGLLKAAEAEMKK
jgi:hypothetical protein